MKKIGLLCILLMASCGSTRLVSSWKNPDIVLFDTYQVLLVGMTEDLDIRTDFETKLQQEFTKRGVESYRSLDLYDVEFTSSENPESELSKVEHQLLEKGFDAILFTKVLGSEKKKTFLEKMDELAGVYSAFNEDALDLNTGYQQEDHYNEYRVYHVETMLYCICVGKAKELIWKGTIDVAGSNPNTIQKAIDDYISLVVSSLGEQDLIFRKTGRNTITSL
ncbi:MAG: hypothetical protein AAGB24_01410 [Bacteroidota bacterium]